MSKRTFVGVMIVALAVVVMAGGLLASNMGFKLNYTLQQPGGGSLTGTNILTLPDNRQTGLSTAKNLMDDIGFAQTANVQRWLKASDGFQTYTGRKGNTAAQDFALGASEGWLVKMNTTVNYIVVGSDDPTLAAPLTQPGAGSLTGTNVFGYNFHQTAATAKAMMDDIGFAQTANVQRWLTASDGFQTYTGRKGNTAAQDFSLVPGQAYLVKMNTTVNYVPSHY